MKNLLITGGSQGIGKATALEAASAPLFFSGKKTLRLLDLFGKPDT